MQHAEAPRVSEWRAKKRKLPRSEIIKRPAPRPPSYVQTQAKTPGYLRIRRLCDTLEEACSAANGEAAALEEARSAFRTGMKSHVAMAARSMLDSMSKAKKLVLLISDQIKRARTLTETLEMDMELDQLLNCFPLRGNERDYRIYYTRVAGIEAEVAMESAIKRDEEDRQMAAQGITRVTWDESDDD